MGNIELLVTLLSQGKNNMKKNLWLFLYSYKREGCICQKEKKMAESEIQQTEEKNTNNIGKQISQDTF